MRRVFLIPARLFHFLGDLFEALGDPGKFSD
jgi:hypothetical protein